VRDFCPVTRGPKTMTNNPVRLLVKRGFTQVLALPFALSGCRGAVRAAATEMIISNRRPTQPDNIVSRQSEPSFDGITTRVFTYGT
jgi:hypothetical protein